APLPGRGPAVRRPAADAGELRGDGVRGLHPHKAQRHPAEERPAVRLRVRIRLRGRLAARGSVRGLPPGRAGQAVIRSASRAHGPARPKTWAGSGATPTLLRPSRTRTTRTTRGCWNGSADALTPKPSTLRRRRGRCTEGSRTGARSGGCKA